MRTRERESQCSSRESEGASEETGETFKRLAGYEGGAMHFFQSKTHTPMVDVAGPKGIHEHVSEVLHAACEWAWGGEGRATQSDYSE